MRWISLLLAEISVIPSVLYRFGAAWSFWVDALVYSSTVLHESYPFTYNIPGIVATIALIMMNLVSRDDLANMGDAFSSEEGSEVRVTRRACLIKKHMKRV
jgi:hypothetical protein